MSPRLIAGYADLHAAGHAHSIEAWQPGPAGTRRLVGGLFGIALGRYFTVESMYHTVDNASKAAFVALVERLRPLPGALIDVQFPSPFFAAFGAREVPAEWFAGRLAMAVEMPRVDVCP